MAIMHVTADNFQTEVLDSAKPVLVDFWATWCGPCRMMGPVLEELDAGSQGAFKVAKVNVDENMELAAAFQINSIPALMIFQNGKLVQQFIGVTDLSVLRNALNNL